MIQLTEGKSIFSAIFFQSMKLKLFSQTAEWEIMNLLISHSLAFIDIDKVQLFMRINFSFSSNFLHTWTSSAAACRTCRIYVSSSLLSSVWCRDFKRVWRKNTTILHEYLSGSACKVRANLCNSQWVRKLHFSPEISCITLKPHPRRCICALISSLGASVLCVQIANTKAERWTIAVHLREQGTNELCERSAICQTTTMCALLTTRWSKS